MKRISWLYRYRYVILAIGIIVTYSFSVGSNPAGIFCDEAQIGVVSWRLIHGDVSDIVGPMLYRHFSYILGILPVITTAPFVWLFGLSDWSVRIASVVWSLATLAVLAITLRRLRLPTVLPIIFLATSPLFFHVSRVNFGHTISLFCVASGLYMYIRSRIEERRIYSALCGIFFGIALFGHGSFMVGVPILVSCIVICEYVFQTNRAHKLRLSILVVMFILCSIPVMVYMIFHPEFLNRLIDKNSGQPVDIVGQVAHAIQKYPKYISASYLFVQGENTGKDLSITRHTVVGNGILLPAVAPFLFLGLLSLVFGHRARPYVLSLVLYAGAVPFVDAITSADGALPYSFSLFQGFIVLPFLVALGWEYYRTLVKRINIHIIHVLTVCIVVTFLFEAGGFFWNYRQNPLYTSDFWGWQYGPKQIVTYFQQHEHLYDEMYLSLSFNEPESLLAFYTIAAPCSKCRIGGLEAVNREKRQLFAVRKEEYSPLSWTGVTVRAIILLPNGEPGYYLVDHSSIDVNGL